MDRNYDRTAAVRFPPGYFALKAGTRVQVKHCASSYPLPTGLEPGDCATVIEFDCGHYSVEKDGQRFLICMTNIVDGQRAPQATAKSAATANRKSHHTVDRRFDPGLPNNSSQAQPKTP